MIVCDRTRASTLRAEFTWNSKLACAPEGVLEGEVRALAI